MAIKFTDFLEKGLCVVPLRGGIPQVEWSRFYNEMPTYDEAKGWEESGHKEVAILCGEMSGVIGLDIDTDDTDLYYTLAGATPLRKKGSKGFTAFYRYNGETSRTWGDVELLSNKRLTTIPPSPHRTTGKPYIWMDGDSWEDLPTIGSDFFTFMDAKFPRKQREFKLPVAHYEDRADLNDAAEMLEFVSSDCNRDTWLHIGMALRDEFGDAACALWHNWSAKSDKYKHNDAQAVWRSFNDSGITIGTIFHLAQEAGYVRPTDYQEGEIDFDIDLSYLDLTEAKEEAVPEMKAHGLVGMIAEWIAETAPRPQPQLALGAAIAFVGALKGHKFSTTTGLRTNVLVLNMAPTGAGKEHPQNCIIRLMRECGLQKNLMAQPVSGTGLLTGLQKADRVALLPIDEVGRFLGNIANKNSGGYQKEIVDYIIQMFSRANGFFTGRQYANEKLTPTVSLVNPHLCVIGSSVKEKIIESCSSADTIDGFLNRWVLFESLDRPKRNSDIEWGQPVPQQIVSAVQRVIDKDPNGMYPLADDAEPILKQVKYTPTARDLMNEYADMIDHLLDASSYPLDSLYVRCCEHVSKLALIFSDDEFVRDRDVKLAIDIVTRSNKLMTNFAGLISNNDKEAEIVKVLDIIRGRKKMSRRSLVQRTRFLGNTKRLNEVVDILASGGDINVTTSETGKSYSVEYIDRESV